MEELRDKLNKLICEKGLMNEKTISASKELDKLIVSHYEHQMIEV
ncbi:MAG: aspartyl-phosphate phosphatase Spo0E family protein [Clostridiaceae bacterium]|nr:aspartyl-phosphate phosphatase Spo0E family protein [Clostridiaceae bacterium]